jgi:hypothetical protein
MMLTFSSAGALPDCHRRVAIRVIGLTVNGLR